MSCPSFRTNWTRLVPPSLLRLLLARGPAPASLPLPCLACVRASRLRTDLTLPRAHAFQQLFSRSMALGLITIVITIVISTPSAGFRRRIPDRVVRAGGAPPSGLFMCCSVPASPPFTSSFSACGERAEAGGATARESAGGVARRWGGMPTARFDHF
jgi:hypothetical protein